MDLDIRGEMEAAAAELEAEGKGFEGDSSDAPPASEPETTGESTEQPTGEQSAAPATEETPAETPASPAQQPEPDELPLGGSIPVPRVRKILENARAKAKAEAEAKLQALSWAEQIDRSQAEEAINIVRFANENPAEFYRQITMRLRENPEVAPEIERVLQAVLPQRSAQPAQPEEDPDPKPKPDILLEDGRMTYSDAQTEKLLTWKERQIERKFSEKLKPFETSLQQQRQAQAVEAESKRVLAEVNTWPGMQDAANRKAVAEAMIQNRIPVDAAYRKVVLPKLTDTKAIEDRVRKQVLAELKNKARASTGDPSKFVHTPDSFAGKSIREVLEATAQELGFED